MAGGTATYTVTSTVHPRATGVTDPGPNSASVSDALTRTVDVVVAKSDGQSAAVPDTAVTHTLVVSTSGPSTATSVGVPDVVPPGLTGVSWTSSTAGGASGHTPQGTGGVTDTLTLPPGGSVTYTITGMVRPDATVPAGTCDVNPANNTATDADALSPTVDVAVATTDGLKTAPAGTTVTYTIVVTNAGPSMAAAVSFADHAPERP